MSRHYEDDDGIDAPFEQAMRAAMHEDALVCMRDLDQWKCTPPVDERELEAERAAVLDELTDEERCPLCARKRAREVTWTLEEGDDLSW